MIDVKNKERKVPPEIGGFGLVIFGRFWHNAYGVSSGIATVCQPSGWASGDPIVTSKPRKVPPIFISRF